MDPKKVLITGANGFVGSNLYDALSGESRLIGLDIAGPGKYPPGSFYSWDELDRLPPVNAIIHLAGKAHDTANVSREEEYFNVNLGLTQKIFDYFLQSGAEKFIFFSSVKAVADNVRGEWLTEIDEPDPQTPYGKSKLAAERYVLKRLREEETERLRDEETERIRDSGTQRRRDGETGERREDGETKGRRKDEETEEQKDERTKGRENEEMIEHIEEGEEDRLNEPHIPDIGNLLSAPCPKLQSPFDSPFTKGDKIENSRLVYILRPAMIHGPGNKGNLNLLYKVVSKGIPWPLGSFDNQRSFASVGNVAFVVREIINRDIIPGIYQVADDETVSTNEIVGLIADSMGKKTAVWHLNRGVIEALARIGDIIRLPLNSERLKKLTETYCVANTKIKAALGITKMPVSVKEGLIRTLSAFRTR